MAARLRFGLFELDRRARKLHKDGQRVRLQDQPFRVLEILLEKPGTLVTRQELRRRLWPTDINVEFEVGLNAAIKRLRLALGDSASHPRFIETVPKRGYCFIASVQYGDATTEPERAFGSDLQGVGGGRAVKVAAEVAPAIGASLTPGPKTKPLSVRLAIIIFFGVTVGLVTYLFRPPPPPLQVTGVTRLSQSGHAFRLEHMLTDGVRLYYHEFTGTSFRLPQVLLPDMGDTLVPGLPPDFLFRGLSPDHTTFLTMPRPVDHLPLPFWLVPVVGGQPRRMGNFLANEAAWSPDGSLLVYARGPDLFVVGSDGTGERFLRSEEHTSELQSHLNLVCRLLLEKKKSNIRHNISSS